LTFRVDMMKLSSSLVRAVAEAYSRLDAEIVRLGLLCKGCGRCCCFSEGEYVLYASSIEIAYLLECFPHVSPGTEEGMCSFRIGDQCSVYYARPLGCRTQFCDPNHRRELEDLCQSFSDQLRKKATSSGVSWSCGQFLPRNDGTVTLP